MLGGKYNLTDVAARVGLGQLPHLERFTAQRRELARAYFEGFEGGAAVNWACGLPLADFADSNWHMFQIVLPLEKLSIDRAGFMAQMKERGIGSACTTRRCICSRCTARAASRKACSRTPSASAPPRSRCRCSRR